MDVKKELKEERQPEHISLHSYNDRGKFSVKIRVVDINWCGLKTPVSVWYKGIKSNLITEENGEVVFNVPETVVPEESNFLTASVSGQKEIKIEIFWHDETKKIKRFSENWWLKTNNGRAFILMVLIICLWTVLFSVGQEGVINKRPFTDESGLYKSEEYYNQISRMVTGEDKFKRPKRKSGFGADIFKWAFIISLVTAVYIPISLRKDIKIAFEDACEKVASTNNLSSQGTDFEKMILRHVRSYSEVQKKSDSDAPNVNKEKDSELECEFIKAIIQAVFNRMLG